MFTHSRAQKTTTASIPATLRFSGAPDPIAAGTDALWIGLNPALDRELQSGQPAQTQKFGSLERLSLTTGAIERTLWIPGFVGPAALHLGNVLWVNHNGGPNRTGPGELDELDWNTGKLLGRLPFDHGVFDLAYGDGSLWVTVGASPATLVRVDPATTRTIGRPIVVAPERALGSTFASGAVWETGFDDGSLARVDPTTGHIDRVKLGGAAVGVVASGAARTHRLGFRGFRLVARMGGRPDACFSYSLLGLPLRLARLHCPGRFVAAVYGERTLRNGSSRRYARRFTSVIPARSRKQDRAAQTARS